MPWEDLQNELDDLFYGDTEYRADSALESWCQRRLHAERSRDRRAYDKARKEYYRAYYQRPEVKARISAHNKTPERRKQRAALEREYHARKRLDPDYVARRREQRRASAKRVKSRTEQVQ